MRQDWLRQFLLIASLTGLAACAGTTTNYPRIDPAAAAARIPVIQAGVVDAVLERKAYVDDLAWPLLVANTDLCHNRRREAFGLTLGNDRTIRDLVDGLTLAQVRAIGYDAAPIVLGVSAGSPAAQAGIVSGAVPVQVGETIINGDFQALIKALGEDRKARQAAKEAGEPAEPLAVIFRHGDALIEAAMQPQEICNVRVRVVENNTINASATANTLRINRGLLTYFDGDDDAVTLVIAHELGHVAGRHVPKLERNAAVSGLYVWGIPVAVGAGLVDLTLGNLLERFAGLETPPGQQAMTSIQNGVLGVRGFEREADYLSIYFAARAGADISNAENVFEQFSRISPRSTYGARSHPITPERMLALAAARAEVEAKQAAGEALIPEGWPYPVPE